MLIKTNAACPIIMTSHLINRQLDESGLPASLSKKIITDLLINQWHFSGLIMTDDMDAQAISKHFNFQIAIEKAILAGNHVIIYDGSQGHSPDDDAKKLFDTLMHLAQKNSAMREKIYQAQMKIYQIKQFFLNDK